jgi:hypothetical protein
MSSGPLHHIRALADSPRALYLKGALRANPIAADGATAARRKSGRRGVAGRPKPESGEEPKLQCVSAAKAGTAMPLPISA